MILLTAEFYNSLNNKIIDVNLHNIVSISNGDNMQSDNKKPSWGIISNEAKLRFFDKDGTILYVIKEQKNISLMMCRIYVNNTLKKKKEQLSEKYVSAISYDKENKSISVSVKDDLEEWQNINVSGFEYKTETSKPMTAKELYLYLSSITPSKFNVCDFSLLDYKTQDLLAKTTISYPMLKSGTLWQSWDKFAKAMGLYIYKSMYYNDDNALVSTTIASADFSVYGV